MSFETLGLHEALLRAIADSGYENATEVQTQAIPPALEGKDLMVSSRTGSGKTASFMLPALQKIIAARGDNTKRREKGKIYGPRILVLTPTRELAMQVAKAAQTYGKHVQGLKVATVLGGMPYALQIRQLSGPLDVLIATPGRLLDHLASGKCVLDNVEMLVLDEADRMLDMGFIDDINTVAAATPEARQTVMYSATFAGHVGRLAQDLLRDPQRVDVASHTDTHENITQRLHWADNQAHKHELLDAILAERELDQAVVFTSTQRDADWLAERLAEFGHAVAPLHGGMPQGKRNRVLMAMRRRDLRVLVATDVAARGIGVPNITHVINYDLPMPAEDYIQRIGRTGRAGREGLAVTLAMRDDIPMIRRIQQFTTQQIPAAHYPGLEPKTQEPRIFPPRQGGDRGGFHGERSFGNKRFQRDDRREGFGRGAPHGGNKGFGPRHGGGFDDRRPFERAPHHEQRDGQFAEQRHGFERRHEGRPEPRHEARHFGEGRPERGFGGPRREHHQQQGDFRREDFAPRRDDQGSRFGGENRHHAGGKPGFGGKPAFAHGKPGGFGAKSGKPGGFHGNREGGGRDGGGERRHGGGFAADKPRRGGFGR